MKFQFPGTYAELREQNYSEYYRVKSKNQIPQMDERLVQIKVNQFVDGFNSDPNLIEVPEQFDLHYHLIEYFEQHPNQKIQLQLIENFTFQIQKLHGQHPEAFKRTLFLLLNLLQQKQIQGQQTRRALKTLCQLFTTNAYVDLDREGSRYMFDLVKMAHEIKDQVIREIWIETLIQSLIFWDKHNQNLKNAIVHIMYESEAVTTNVGKFLVACSKNEKTNCYAVEQIILLMNYITEKSTNQTESLAVKNLRELFSSTSKEMPKLYYLQMSALVGLYNNENYHIRNGLSDLIANVIEYLIKNYGENNYEDNYLANAKKLIERLIERDLDKTAHCRSNVLQNLAQLLTANCIPKEFLDRIFVISSQRLKDISGYVRKSSLQLLKSVMRYQRRLYVQSQGLEQFWTKEEIEEQIKQNQLEIGEIQKEFLIFEKQFQDGTINQVDLDEQVSTLKKRAAESIKLEEYLEKYQKFLLNMRKVQSQVLQLCSSKNQTDVMHSIKLFAYLKKYQFDQADIGFRRMLLLVWSQDKSIQAEVIKKFWKLYLRDTKKTRMIVLSIIDLIQESNQKELISVQKILLAIETEQAPNYKFPAKTFHILWEFLGNPQVDQKSTLIFIRIMLNRNPTYLTNEKVGQISQILQAFRQGNPDWTIIRELADIIQKLDKKDEKCKNTFDQTIDLFIALLIKYVKTSDMKYFSAVDSIVELASQTESPEFVYDTLLSEMIFKKNNMDVETQESKIKEQFHLSHMIYIAGSISLQFLIMIDDAHNKFNKEKEEREKSVGQEKEVDKVQGGMEAEFERLHDLLDNIQNSKLIHVNLLSVFSPMVRQIIDECLSQIETEDNLNKQQPPIVQVSLLTMCKFMCLSERYCQDNLYVLFDIMRSPVVDQVMKNNVIISIGDLLHRWPNIVQKFHKQIYSNLTDSCVAVRKVTLQVLTHLILNDMIKSKISLSHIPQLLSDPSPQIQAMTKYFLNELFKKEPRAISNALPDIVSHVYNQNELIFQQVAQYVDKQNLETIVDNLITILAHSQDQNEIKNISIIFPLLNLSLASLQKLLNGWEEYREKLKDQFVHNQFLQLIRKVRRILPQDSKPLIDEYEQKIEHHEKETFDGRRREKVSKRKNAKQQNEQPEQQQQQQEEKEGRGTKQQKRRQRKKKEDDFMELESDDEEQSEESIVIKKQTTQRRRRIIEQENE